MTFNLGSYIPDRKWIAGGIGGLATAGILAIAKRYDVEIPDWTLPFIPVAVGKLVSYITWPTAQDIIKRINGDLAAAAGYMPSPTPQAAALRAVVIAPSLPLDPATKVIVAQAKQSDTVQTLAPKP